jgi:hypothetical protein
LLIALLTGCGSIIHGNTQRIHVNSDPPGAEVLYDGGIRGVTPTDVPVSRRPLQSHVTLRKAGFRDTVLTLKADVSMWALLGNIVVGGIPGWAIDAATGSFGAYYMESYTVSLESPTPTTAVAERP